MSNEYYDIAALASSRVDGAGVRTWRLGLFCQILLACVSGRPCLEEMGLRLWVLCERLCPGSMPRTNREMRRRLWVAESAAWKAMQVMPGETSVDDCGRLVDLLTGGECEPVRLGRRVTLLGYAFERGPEMRAVFPSFENIGEHWGLRARNKRSAVSAAMRGLVRTMVERGQLRVPEAHELTELWFAKKRVTRERYAAAQVGNSNRLGDSETGRRLRRRLGDSERGRLGEWETGRGGDSDSDDEPASVREMLRLEHEERISGVPVRREFAGMSPRELRAHFEKLERAAEARRLGLVG